MVDVPDTRSFDDATIEGLLQEIHPGASLRSATPAERGFCTVYEVEFVADGDGSTAYLKAAPDDEQWGIPTEARIQTVLDAHTGLSIPPVLGAVDEHDSLPAPAFLMAALPGEELDYEDVCRLADAVLRRLATETGRSLAQLHAVPAPDTFGLVTHDGPAISGDVPAVDSAVLSVDDGADSWPAWINSYAETELDRLADSRFDHLAPQVREWVTAEIDELSGSFSPALARNDHGLHNLLIDSDTGEITGQLDWGYTIVAPPAFDVAFATYIYSGAFFAGLSEFEDRRPLVERALLEGYSTAVSSDADPSVTVEPLYELLAMVRIMNDFEHLTVPGDERDAIDEIEAQVLAVVGE